jgi:hypothetical protein
MAEIPDRASIEMNAEIPSFLGFLAYPWKTNQYGLTCDSVTAFELVKPNGDVVRVTQQSDSQLFVSLKVSCTVVGFDMISG